MIEDTTLTVSVTHTDVLCEGVRAFRLARVDGLPLPHFSAGSHVVVEVDTGERILRNPYSLISDGDRYGEPIVDYEIAVALNRPSRGGSAWLHEFARPGARLRIGWPHNLFGLVKQARHHLLFAGGIGITPIFAMARALSETGASFEVHYAFRSPDQAPLLGRLSELMARAGDRQILHEYDASLGSRLSIAAALSHRPLGTHAYVCGPQRMIDDVRAAARDLGWPDGAVHAEAFLAPAGGDPFSVLLERSGRELTVAADQSLLEALEACGADVDSLCRGGACGACRTAVVAGELIHADHVLTADERRSGQWLMPCVSRGRGRLILDL